MVRHEGDDNSRRKISSCGTRRVVSALRPGPYFAVDELTCMSYFPAPFLWESLAKRSVSKASVNARHRVLIAAVKPSVPAFRPCG